LRIGYWTFYCCWSRRVRSRCAKYNFL